ncbi:hypothetical protein FRC19_007759 [Serendipita sp. 401]|nr:hypothetical protein FRC19_007759 [Serendipita sp. 401]KAG9057251.1 hypothetical protein FS842_008058 [Serendipita sp. 407]
MASNWLQKGLQDVESIVQSATQPGVGNTLRKERLRAAIRSLRMLERSCESKGDLGTVLSRLLHVQVQLLEAFRTGGPTKQDMPELLYQVEEVLTVWTWIYRNPQCSFDSCSFALRSALRDLALEHFTGLDNDRYLHSLRERLETAGRKCEDPFIFSVLFEVTYIILDTHLRQAVGLFGKGKWAMAMSMLKGREAELDSFAETEEKRVTKGVGEAAYAMWGMGDYYIPEKAMMLKREYEIQSSVCRATQLLHVGDLNFQQSMTCDPDDMMAYALLAQDDYRAALVHIMGQDVETEGAVLARLARFHAKLLKLPVVAHQLYLRAIQLAATLAPVLPRGQWYNDCVQAVQAYRDALQAEDLKKWEAIRQPILEKLSDQIKKLNDAKSKSNLEFSKFIFAEWPPKTEGPTEVPIDPEDPTQISKKAFLKVIQRYHVDKNQDKGDEWRVMSEEISKALTARYNVMKGM